MNLDLFGHISVTRGTFLNENANLYLVYSTMDARIWFSGFMHVLVINANIYNILCQLWLWQWLHYLNNISELGLVAHNCNLSTPGSWGRRSTSLSPRHKWSSKGMWLIHFQIKAGREWNLVRKLVWQERGQQQCQSAAWGSELGSDGC